MYKYSSNKKLNIDKPFDFKISVYDDCHGYGSPNDSGEKIEIHKEVLINAGHSTYNFSNKKSEKSFNAICFNTSDLKKIINFLYTGNIKFVSFKDLFYSYLFCRMHDFYKLANILETMFDANIIVKTDDVDSVLFMISDHLSDSWISYHKKVLYKVIRDIMNIVVVDSNKY
jgi:hypothetical protein